MKTDLSAIKHRLKDYLHAKGIKINRNNTLTCFNHADDKPSMVYYPQGKSSPFPVLWCPVCQWKGNIFDVCGHLENLTEFKDQIKSVEKTLGVMQPISETPDNPKQKKSKPSPVALNYETAKDIYTAEAIMKLYEKSKSYIEGMTINGTWKYFDADGKFLALDVRLEKQGERKIPLTFWYDGKYLRFANAPVCIYNLQNAIKTELPLLINEGAKCADAANILTDNFCPVSWSGGSGKAHLANWGQFTNHEGYIIPDDDHKTDSDGKELPLELQPGFKAALKIQEKNPHWKIVLPPEGLTYIKSDGGDIVEWLQLMSPDEITAYILNPDNHYKPHVPEMQQEIITDTDTKTPDYRPFQILGIDHNGRANFVTRVGRHVTYNLESLNKIKLLKLADINYWRMEYSPEMSTKHWDDAINDIMRLSEDKDFNDDNIRGRGAWRDGDKISYHDGIKTHGEKNEKMTYLRLPKKDIGIEDTPADEKLVTEIKQTIMKLSFDTSADAVRTLGWAALAPFAGALKYRPSIMITGPSGSGKSTVQEVILKNLTDFIWCDTKETSTAGIRSKIGKDSTCVFFEEADKTTDKMKLNVDDILAFARSNYTSNSPDGFKGTKDGGWVNYKMNSMFGIASINPMIEQVADENRIFRVNMVKPSGAALSEWKTNEKILLELLSQKNCRAVRSLTWSKLKTIFALSERTVEFIQKSTGRDYRSSYADSLLASAFIVIWNYCGNPTDAQLEEMLSKYYQLQPAEAHRDEAREMIDRLFDEVIEVIHEGQREKLTIMECATRIKDEGVIKPEKYGDPEIIISASKLMEYKRTLARNGIKVRSDLKIAIAHKNHIICKVLNVGLQYDKVFRRMEGATTSKESFTGDRTRCATVLTGILMSEDERITQGLSEVM